jgi:hypothetical protein
VTDVRLSDALFGITLRRDTVLVCLATIRATKHLNKHTYIRHMNDLSTPLVRAPFCWFRAPPENQWVDIRGQSVVITCTETACGVLSRRSSTRKSQARFFEALLGSERLWGNEGDSIHVFRSGIYSLSLVKRSWALLRSNPTRDNQALAGKHPLALAAMRRRGLFVGSDVSARPPPVFLPSHASKTSVPHDPPCLDYPQIPLKSQKMRKLFRERS